MALFRRLLGDVLRERRLGAGLTLRQVSAEARVSLATSPRSSAARRKPPSCWPPCAPPSTLRLRCCVSPWRSRGRGSRHRADADHGPPAGRRAPSASACQGRQQPRFRIVLPVTRRLWVIGSGPGGTVGRSRRSGRIIRNGTPAMPQASASDDHVAGRASYDDEPSSRAGARPDHRRRSLTRAPVRRCRRLRATAARAGAAPAQFVVVSFDGVGWHQEWQHWMSVAAQVPFRFTGFVGTYLLSPTR